MENGKRWKSTLLVTLQMVCILLLLALIPFLRCDGWALGLSGMGVLLGCWAVAAMRLSNLSVMPDVRADARLVTAGPYKVIRHPMYAAVLLVFTPPVLDQPSWSSLPVLMVLWVTLLVKLNYEEGMLRDRFREYAAYADRSWRLIPFVY